MSIQRVRVDYVYCGACNIGNHPNDVAINNGKCNKCGSELNTGRLEASKITRAKPITPSTPVRAEVAPKTKEVHKERVAAFNAIFSGI